MPGLPTPVSGSEKQSASADTAAAVL